MEVRKQYQIRISNRFAALENLSDIEKYTNALYSLWDDARDDGLVIVRNM